ncbi:MAG: VF530 family DNA-binding protein [Pontiella sp.]
MSIEDLQNNPLQGVGAETMVTELVEFYGWEILYAAMGLKCFKVQPTISSCVTFLKKSEWGREKVENFYLYRFKRMPKDRESLHDIKPRERGFANGIVPRDPLPLTVEKIREMKAQAEESHKGRPGSRRSRY